MDIREYLSYLINGSNLVEKASVVTKTNILWFLKDGANKEEAEKYINLLQKEITSKATSLNIEFKIVENAEKIVEQIEYTNENKIERIETQKSE